MIIGRIGPEGKLPYRAAVFVSAILTAIALGVIISHNPRPTMENHAEDALARMAPRAVRNDVVVVAIDDESVKKYGPVKSWPRSLLAGGLKRIEDAGAKWVTIDLPLDERTKTGDESLWRHMANSRNVILGMAYDANRSQTYTPDDIRSLVFLEKYVIADNITFGVNTPQFPYYLFEPPVSDFAGSSRGVGVFDRETDTDGFLRQVRLVYLTKVEYPATARPLRGKFPQTQLADGVPAAVPNVALVSALRAFGLDKNEVKVTAGDTLSLSANITPEVAIPVDEQGRMLIRYYGPAGSFVHYSFKDLMDGKLPKDSLKGKNVLLGSTATGESATDPKATPFGQMPRVEVTATALTTILDRSYYGVYTPRILGMLIVLGLITGLILMLLSGARAAVAALLLVAAYLGMTYALYAFGHTMLPILPGIMTILVPFLIGLLLYIGPMKPTAIESSPTYVPPPPGVTH